MNARPGQLTFRRIYLCLFCILTTFCFCGGTEANPITNWTRNDLLAAKAEWRRLGFKLELSEFQLAGSSLAQMQAAAAITNFGNVVSHRPTLQRLPPMKPVSENYSLVISSQAILPENYQQDLWPGVRQSLQEQKELLDALRGTVVKTPIRFDLKAGPGGDILLPQLASFKRCGGTFSDSAILNLHDGKRAEAWSDLMTLATMTARWEVDPIEISYLVRGALVKITYATLWEMLSSPRWSEEQLSDLQQILERIDLFSKLPDAYALQRATISANFAAAREPDSTFIDELKTVAQNPRQAIPLAQSAWQQRKAQKEWVEKWSYIEEGLILEDLIAKETALKKALHEKTWQQMRPIWLPVATNEINQAGLGQARILPRLKSQRMIMAWVSYSEGAQAGTLGRILEAEANRRLMLTAVAIERYRLEHGAIPSSLDLLVPKFLKSVPEDPIDGKSLRYAPEANGEFLLYSIALDQADNGGKQNVRGGLPGGRRQVGVDWIQPHFDWVWPKRTTIAPPHPKPIIPIQGTEDDEEAK